jgi:hypothetical protein
MSAISLLSLCLLSLLSLRSLAALAISLIQLSLRDRMFHVKLAGMGQDRPLSLLVMDITAKPIDKIGSIPYPEGIRGGWVNTNIWLLGVGISLIKKRKPR